MNIWEEIEEKEYMEERLKKKYEEVRESMEREEERWKEFEKK